MLFDYWTIDYWTIDRWTVALLLTIGLLLWFRRRNNDDLKKLGIKGPKPLPVIGLLHIVLVKPVAQLEIEWFNKYGKIYKIPNFFDPSKKQLVIGDPDLIKIILVKDFHVFHNRNRLKTTFKEIPSLNLFNSNDELWKRIRTIVSPTFTSGKMKQMFPLIKDCIKHCLNNFESHVINRKEVNLKDVYGCLTMDVIAKCAFATNINANRDKNNPFVVNAANIFKTDWQLILKLFIIPTFVLDFFKISLFNEQANEFFFDVARHIIRKRRDKNEKQNDFLQLLMDCHKEDNPDTGSDESDIKSDEKALSEDEIIAQVWIFFLAGYETTASTLSYCSYELAINQSVQDKLYNEIKSAVKDDEIDYELLSKLPYLDAVISETLRKYPPLTKLERLVCQDNYHLGDTGIVLDKGDLVEIPAYAIHHSEQYFHEPELFKPERFLPENRDLIKPYTYLPFGSGPRNCVGMRFGLLEAKLALSKVILKYKFIPSQNTDIPLQFTPVSFVLTARRICIDVERR